jgi:glutamyl-tRNA(Gln) amidotransferase subunit D
MNDRPDDLKGYRGLARERLQQWGVRVWSDVLVVNNAGSAFEGVILPRSENADDLHIVLKQKTGYNVGIHVDRVTSIQVIGHKEAIYKIPEKVFPTTVDLPNVTLLGTGGTIASRLDYRTLRSRARAGANRQHDDEEDFRRLLREHGVASLCNAGPGGG